MKTDWFSPTLLTLAWLDIVLKQQQQFFFLINKTKQQPAFVVMLVKVIKISKCATLSEF